MSICYKKSFEASHLHVHNGRIHQLTPLESIMETLSLEQYGVVYNMFSFTIASMLGAFAFFILARERVAPKYRISLIVSAIVVGIAAYHYFRIMGSWEHATEYVNGAYSFNADLFNDAYRYVDWLLTVPLLLAELVLVMGLTRQKSEGLLTKLIFAAIAMIALGYPGEGAAEASSIILWGVLSTIPFAYILYVLWGEVGTVIDEQGGRVGLLLRNARWLLVATWGFYPITYALPLLGADCRPGGNADWICRGRCACESGIWRLDLYHRTQQV